jgi:hypothetical protein
MFNSILVALLFEVQGCSGFFGIAGSNPAEGSDVFLLCMLCVL